MKNCIPALVAFLLLTMFSCRKENVTPLEWINASEDVATHQDLTDANEEEVDAQVALGFTSEAETRAYPTRTWAQPKGTFPNTLTIDYGPVGVTGPHGHVRKGIILVALSNAMNVTGATRTVTTQNFTVDDVLVEGVVTVVNQGPNGSGQNVFVRTVTNRKLTFPSGKISQWNGQQTITQLEGSATADRNDDVFSMTGSTSGTTRNGKSFNTNTNDALVKRFTCAWPEKGTFVLTVETKTISINYGDGSCDNKATLTLPDGTVKEIYIKRWW